jgi:predicted metal-binding protein
MEKNRCEECQSYIGHHPTCSLIDFDECKKRLNQYYHAWLVSETKTRNRITDAYLKINKAKLEQQFWKGKFNEVKLENNTLRKKIINLKEK